MNSGARFEAALIEHLQRRPHPHGTVESLKAASRLIENAAYSLADHSSGEDLVQLLLLAAKINEVAKRHKVGPVSER